MKTRTLILALMLVMTSSHVMAQGRQNKEKQVEKTVMNNILTRTSVRRYQDKAVEAYKVENLLKAGMAAPSAVNRQPWHFVVVDDKDVLQGLAKANPNAGMAARAPLAIVVCGDMNKALEGDGRDFWIHDTSAATENILLAANGMGLGAVWTGTYPNLERCKAVRKVLNLPESMIPLCTIVIGYPDNMPSPKQKFKEENISYNSFGKKYTPATPVIQNGGFVEFDVQETSFENPFNIFTGWGMLLCAGDREKSNAMTIGWGGLGTIWGQNNMVTVYVAEKRYTKKFMDKSKYFTIMAFDEKHQNVLQYMGTKSGADGDKAAALGLHTAYTENGTPYYEEASMVLECELMYADAFEKENMRDIPARLYANFPAGVHTFYIGRIVKALKK